MEQTKELRDFEQLFKARFGMALTADQENALGELKQFTFSTSLYPLLILQGYAGTGKTTLLGAYVNILSAYKLKTRLLAPTGRAAKVLGNRAGKEAFTIHKQIYRRRSGTDEFSAIDLVPNLHTNTVFIVDEASMIPEHTQQSNGGIARDLLGDLLEYVYAGKNCRLIFLGDRGQLPPVGSLESPALEANYLKNAYPKLDICSVQLTEVVRQEKESGILFNATGLRSTEFPDVFDFDFSFPDFHFVEGDELQELIDSTFSNYGAEECIVITRSNKRANLYNGHIRSRILWYEDILCQNDCLMVVKNNYFWLNDESKAGFIANGENLRVKRIRRIEELYGFEFARIVVQMEDYPDEPEFEVLILLESINCEGPSLSRERLKELFFEIEKDYAHEKNKRKRYDLILKNPYFNALQVKYAYAVTCHKSQGGQWSVVFVDPGFLPEDASGESYYRWLYTAITRATEHVYLVNFKDTKV
jgi:exodeoxyribonuclease-5